MRGPWVYRIMELSDHVKMGKAKKTMIKIDASGTSEVRPQSIFCCQWSNMAMIRIVTPCQIGHGDSQKVIYKRTRASR